MKNNKYLIFLFITIILGCNSQPEKKYKFNWDDLCNNKNGMPIKFITSKDLEKKWYKKIL